MKKFILPAVVLMPAMSLFAVPPGGETAYIYQGNPFAFFDGVVTCPDVCGLQGSFVVGQPLGADLSGALISPLAYSFTDGLATLNDTTGYNPQFQVWTDSSGNVVNWGINLQGAAPAGDGGVVLYSEYTVGNQVATAVCRGQAPNCNDDEAFYYNPGFVGEAGNGIIAGQEGGDPGTWTSAPVPEPGTQLLLIFGLPACFVPALRRRLQP